MKRLPVLLSLMAAVVALPTMAHAQAYAGDGNYLRLPPSYQQATTARPTFAGQGMGQGQVQSQGQMQAQAMPTSASSRMLPPGMVQQPVMQQPMVQQSSMQPLAQPVVQPAAVQTMQPQLQPVIVQQPMLAADVPQAAVRPVAMSHSNGIAGSMPPTNNTIMGGSSNVELRPACDLPDNHRAANKGLNTSTTVFGDCLN